MKKLVNSWFLLVALAKAVLLIPIGLVLFWLAGALVWSADKDHWLYLILAVVLAYFAGNLVFKPLVPLVGGGSNDSGPSSKSTRRSYQWLRRQW